MAVGAMKEKGEEAAVETQPPRGRHIKKRARRNKALSVTFDEKDLRDYVTGFQKRKKKRRKEAQRQQEEAKRRHRIEQRKKRKMDKEYVLYGGAHPPGSQEHDVGNQDLEEDEDEDQTRKVSGTKTYDKGDLKVTVTTSEITREEEDINPGAGGKTQSGTTGLHARDTKNNIPISKTKSFKKSAQRRAGPKPQNKRDKRKGKIWNK